VELRYLRYFATVAEQQSFTRAAEKLRVAQSAISQQIKTLEEELEVTLLSRTKRSVKLTAAGHAFLREAKDILNRVEQSKVEVCRTAQVETGTLSIGCNWQLAPNPAYQVEVVTSDAKGRVTGMTGLQLVGNVPYFACTGEIDTLLIAGGAVDRRRSKFGGK
jgi:molybdenum-dependent DNA-binding transcriptional regulator ModE